MDHLDTGFGIFNNMPLFAVFVTVCYHEMFRFSRDTQRRNSCCSISMSLIFLQGVQSISPYPVIMKCNLVEIEPFICPLCICKVLIKDNNRLNLIFLCKLECLVRKIECLFRGTGCKHCPREFTMGGMDDK